MTLHPGDPCPDWKAVDCFGKEHTRNSLTGPQGLLVAFICNHCPFVIHLKESLAEVGRLLQAQGIGMVAICSNDVERYPDDSPEKMREDCQRYQYPFPYLVDQDQTLARAYFAACTPDFFLSDASHRLYYAGQWDDSRPGGNPPDGASILAAARSLILGEPPPENSKPSVGCNIKWLPGKEPAWFAKPGS